MSTRRPFLIALVVAALALCAWLLVRDFAAGQRADDSVLVHSSESLAELRGDGAARDAVATRVADTSASAAAAAVARAGLIRGRVVRPGGAGVGGVDVFALDRYPAFAQFEVRIRDFIEHGFWKQRVTPVAEVLARTTTAGDGSFELRGLPDGRVFLDARSSSWYTRSQPGVRLARGEQKSSIEILLTPAGRVRGRVLDAADTPVVGARVVLRPSASAFLAQITARSFRWIEGRTDDQGRFDLAGVPPGDGYAVTGLAPGMALAQARDVAVRVGHTVEVTLRGSKGAVLTGVVRTPDGKPAPDALVGFAYMDLARVLFSREFGNPAHTDASGHYRLEHVGAGHIVVSALASSYALAPPADMRVADGASYHVDLELSLGSRLAGVVVDDAGKPIEGAAISARTLEQPRGFDLSLVAKLVRYEATSDAEGRFTLNGIVSDRMFVAAEHPGHVEVGKVWHAGETLRLTLHHAAFVAGRVVDQAGEPVPRFRVRVRPASERRIRIGPRWGRMARRPNPYRDRSPWLEKGEFEVQDSAGQFRVGPVEPGKLRVTVDAVGFVASDARELEVAPGRASAETEFKLTRGAIVRGRVLAGRGGPPVGEAQVTWRVPRSRERRGRGILPFRITAEPEDLDFMALDSTFGTRSVLTDADGRFELVGVRPGKINLTARHPAYAKVSKRGIEVAATHASEGLVLELTPGGAIEGQVTGLNGKPIGGATVVAASIPKGVVKSGVTDSAGHYKITALTPGSYIVVKTKMDAALDRVFADLVGNVRLKSATVREGRTSRVDIADRRKGGVDLYGRVTSAGQPVPRAVVVLFGSDRGGPFGIGVRTATADDAGNFELPSVSPGNYRCQITRYTSRRPERSSQSLVVERSLGRVRVDLEFPSGEIQGVVVDPSGKRIAGVRLRAMNEARGSSPGGLVGLISELGGTARARSGNDGTFHLRRLPPGRYRIVAEPRGGKLDSYGSGTIPGVQLAPGQKVEGLQLTLPLASMVEGRVHDGQGQPVAGAIVRAIVADATVRPVGDQALGKLARQLRHTTRSGADGRFRLRGLLPGQWRFLAEKKDLSAEPTIVRIQIGANPQVELAMVRGAHLRLRVLGLDGKSLAAGKIRVFDSSGRQVGTTKSLFSVMAQLFGSKQQDGGSGWLDLGVLKPDTYTLEVTRTLPAGKSEVRRVKRRLQEGEDARWEVPMVDLIR